MEERLEGGLVAPRNLGNQGDLARFVPARPGRGLPGAAFALSHQLFSHATARKSGLAPLGGVASA